MIEPLENSCGSEVHHITRYCGHGAGFILYTTFAPAYKGKYPLEGIVQ